MENIQEFKLQARLIRYLARYYSSHFMTEENESDIYDYGLSAYELLLNSVQSRADYKEFEYLSGIESYVLFEEIFELRWLDICVHLFEQ